MSTDPKQRRYLLFTKKGDACLFEVDHDKAAGLGWFDEVASIKYREGNLPENVEVIEHKGRTQGSGPVSSPELSVGDRVEYTAAYLRSIGAVTGPLGPLKGTIRRIEFYSGGLTLVSIDWDRGPSLDVNIRNLKKVGAWEPN